jgi:hypothetical protein
MMGRLRLVIRATACAAVIGAAMVAGTSAADISPKGSPTSVGEMRALTESYLKREAALLLVRATFNVMPVEDVEPALERQLHLFGANGPSPSDLDRLDRDLLAEGSYLLVSLRYTIDAGGAVWPYDRSEASYERDTLAELDILTSNWIATVESQSDPLPILLSAQSIMALTNGEKTVPPAQDHFGRRDELVNNAIEVAAPWAKT